MSENESVDGNTMHLMANKRIRWYDWRRKFINRVKNTKIQNLSTTKVLILSGTHGTKKGNSCLRYSQVAEYRFYLEDMEIVDDFSRDSRTDQIVFKVRLQLTNSLFFTLIIVGC
jgi:hypothetical protein